MRNLAMQLRSDWSGYLLRAPKLLCFVCMTALHSFPTNAQQSAEEFFRGKTVTVVIPTTPGGDRGGNATVLLSHISRHIPGNPRVIPNFMPGAGGLVAMNYLNNVAPRDGTFIASPLTTFIVAQVTGEQAVRYDVSKMNWIGRTTESTQVLYVWHTVHVHGVDDAKKRVVTVGSSGVNSPSTIIPQIMNNVFGTQFRVIQGYKGSTTFNLATSRGETDASLTTWGNLRNNHSDWVREKKARVLFQVLLTRHPELQDVPTAHELAKTDEDKSLIDLMTSSAELGQAFIAPPDVPSHIVDALRRAFDATMTDPEYIAISKKMGNELNPMTGAELAALAARTLATPKTVVERYHKATSVR